MYRMKRVQLGDSPCVGLEDMMVNREDAIVEKVRSSTARQNARTSLNKVLIGAVPDRGGRTDPPP